MRVTALCCFVVLNAGCGESEGSRGGKCYPNGTCNDGLACNEDNECEKAIAWSILDLSGPDPLAAAGIVSCSERVALGAQMRAILDIGGEEPCELDVDPSTLVPSGSCAQITIGIVRPLGLGYWLPHPTNSNDLVLLAYVVSWVDLSAETIQNNPEVSVTFVAGDVIDCDSELEAWPIDDNNCASIVDEEDQLVCWAQAWARPRLIERSVDFDLDDDSESNVLEACAGTLFD